MRDRLHQQQDDGIQRHKGNVDQDCCSWALQTNEGFDQEVLCDKAVKIQEHHISLRHHMW